jgi:hypothetical protein
MRWLIEVNILLFYDEMPLNAFGGGRYARISCVGVLAYCHRRLLRSHH